MSDLTDITKAIARVRRAMPRNEDVGLICGELETRLQAAPEGKFDKRAYQRELMRKRRAEGKA